MLSLLLTLCLLAPMSADTTDAPLPHYPTPVDTVTVDGRAIAYYEAGEGAPLLFVHGLGSNMALWRDALNAFAEDYRVLALDLPGFGRSAKDDVPGTMDFFAETVVGFLDAHGIDRVRYVGVSMGGQVGMTLALMHPERVAQLALVSPAGIEAFTAEQGTAIKNTMRAEGIMAADSAAVAQNVKLNFASWDAQHQWLIDQRHALAQRSDFPAYAEANARAVAGMLDGPVRDRLEQLQVPTLVLFGAGDRLIPNRYLHPTMTPTDVADEARAALPHAEVHLVEDAGHLLMLEQPEAFRQYLRAFLNGGGRDR